MRSVGRYIFILTLAVLTLSSCAKIESSRLEGEWRVVSVGDCGWPDTIVWRFYSDGELTLTNDVNGLANGTVSASWEAYTAKWRKYVRIKASGSWFQGNWRIDKHTAKKLTLTRESFLDGSKDGAFLRREFKRN